MKNRRHLTLSASSKAITASRWQSMPARAWPRRTRILTCAGWCTCCPLQEGKESVLGGAVALIARVTHLPGHRGLDELRRAPQIRQRVGMQSEG